MSGARTLGLWLGGLGLTAALGAALFADPPPAAPPQTVASPPMTSPPVPTPQPSLEIASVAAPPAGSGPVGGAAPATGAAVEFLVRFKPGHPLAQAAALAGGGREAEAEALARRTLTSRRDLAGLCLKGFTLGGAEVVLRPCVPVETRKAESASRQWLRHLRGLGAVQYADRNVTLQPGAARP